MPIEIRELVIRARIGDGPGPASSDGDGPDHGLRAAPGGLSAEQTEQLVQECVRQVLRVLAQQQER